MSEDNTKDYLDESRPELKDNEGYVPDRGGLKCGFSEDARWSHALMSEELRAVREERDDYREAIKWSCIGFRAFRFRLAKADEDYLRGSGFSPYMMDDIAMLDGDKIANYLERTVLEKWRK